MPATQMACGMGTAGLLRYSNWSTRSFFCRTCCKVNIVLEQCQPSRLRGLCHCNHKERAIRGWIKTGAVNFVSFRRDSDRPCSLGPPIAAKSCQRNAVEQGSENTKQRGQERSVDRLYKMPFEVLRQKMMGAFRLFAGHETPTDEATGSR